MLVQKTNQKRTVWMIVILVIIAIITIYTLLNGGLFGSGSTVSEGNDLNTTAKPAISSSFDTSALKKLSDSFKSWADESMLAVGTIMTRNNPFVPSSVQNINDINSPYGENSNVNSPIIAPIVPISIPAGNVNTNNPAAPLSGNQPPVSQPIAPIIPITY